MAIPLRRSHAMFISLEPTNTNVAPAPAQATSAAALSVPAARPLVPLKRTHAIFIPLESAPTNASIPPPPAPATSSTTPSVPTTRPPAPLRRTHAIFIPLEPAPTNTALPPPSQPTSSTAPSVPATRPPVPLRRTHATLIPLEPAPTNTVPPSQPTPSTTPVIPAAVATPAPSASTSTPVAELSFPLPQPDMLPACSYACGRKLCDWCAKDRPPVGHQNPIPNFIVATIIRHAVPHRFDSLEKIKEREVATGLVDPPNNVGEDDVEYQPGGDFKPPAWGSDKARPKKSAMRITKSDPATRNALLQRSTEDIKASLDEALANSMKLNYEGPVAIAIRNEISAIDIPGEKPFKWAQSLSTLARLRKPSPTITSEATADAEPAVSELASSMEEDLEDEVAVVELVLPTCSKKRRFAEDDDDPIALDATGMATEGSLTKKARTTRKLPGSKIPPFNIPSFRFPSLPLTLRVPSSFSTAWSSPSPIRSGSPSTTSTMVATDSSSDVEPLQAASDSSSSPRKARIVQKKLRFQFTDPASTHPKFGTPDSIYWHHRRLSSTSKNVRSHKKHKEYAPKAETWSPEENEHAVMGMEDWDAMRKASLLGKTSRMNLEERAKRSEGKDADAERFQKLVERYEADCGAIDLAGVRARFIRPRNHEVPRKKNNEAMPLLRPVDEMRRHYPAWDHAAWDGVERAAIVEWARSPHYELKVGEVLDSVVKDEEKAKGKGNQRVIAELDEATEIATVADEDEERMRREYVAAEVDEVEAPRRGDSGSAWGAPAPGEGERGLHRQTTWSAVDLDSRWSAPSAHHPTDVDAGWSTPGAGPSTILNPSLPTPLPNVLDDDL